MHYEDTPAFFIFLCQPGKVASGTEPKVKVKRELGNYSFEGQIEKGSKI